MKYVYKIKKKKNTFALEVICSDCKNPILIYQKGGKGNLIKCQFHRIYESERDINEPGNLVCPFCKQLLAHRGKFKNNETFWLIRGRTNNKILNNYK